MYTVLEKTAETPANETRKYIIVESSRSVEVA